MNKFSEEVTIKDIAKHLGVSIATVSRALRDRPEVNPKTKAAVLEYAKKLKYRPNLMAAGLITRNSKIIGVIIPQIAHLFFSKIIEGIQEVAFNHGYAVMISQSNESYKSETLQTEVLLSNRVAGLLVAPSTETQECNHFKGLHERGFPLVFFDRVCQDVDASIVVVDDFEGAYNAIQHLVEIGCKRIAHIAGPPKLSVAKDRIAGYKAAINKYKLPFREEYIIHTDLTEKSASEAVEQLMSLERPPDGIFCINDTTAVGVMLKLKQLNYNIPNDVALVGFTNDHITELVEPTITTVEQPAYEIGRVACELFLNQMAYESGRYLTEKRILKTKLIKRASTLGKLNPNYSAS